MKKRVTIQDIADELGLSRNTISKAINGTGSVSADTKELIFQKAGELGYKQFGLINSVVAEVEKPFTNREIALFTCSVPGAQYLSSILLDSFQKEISSLGYRLIVYMLREDIVSSCTFPENFNEDATDAILVMELFDKTYTSFLCGSGIPTLFVDSVANLDHEMFLSDTLYMENTDSSYRIVCHLIETGCKTIGFIGDRYHCQSFYERWRSYRDVMERYSMPDYDKYCIYENDSEPYQDTEWLAGKIRQLYDLPDAFFCANDFLAVCVIKALKSLGYSLPEDVKVAGFDNSNEAQIIEPPLTTATIHGTEMGHIATTLLTNRIKHPDAPYISIYVQTDVIYRSSTER